MAFDCWLRHCRASRVMSRRLYGTHSKSVKPIQRMKGFGISVNFQLIDSGQSQVAY